MRLLAGMDVSGNQTVGNHKFMSIVIGTQENIVSTYKLLEREKIHMSGIKNKEEQKRIISKLNFNSDENIVFCLRIDRDPIVKKIKKLRKARRISEKKIIRTYHYILLQQIRDKIEAFLQTYSTALTDVTFQCEGDCRNFARDNGLHQTNVIGIAHTLSDIVAWANNKGQELDGIIPLDLTSEIENKLIERIFR